MTAARALDREDFSPPGNSRAEFGVCAKAFAVITRQAAANAIPLSVVVACRVTVPIVWGIGPIHTKCALPLRPPCLNGSPGYAGRDGVESGL